MKRFTILLVFLAAAVQTWAQPSGMPRRPANDSTNPTVFDYPTAHDPVVAFCDGRYYLFTTGMTCMSSDDMKNWHFEDPVFRQLPQWARDKGFRGMPWAPDIRYHNGLWYIYYSCSSFGKNGSAIGVAVNRTLNPKSPDFGWEDKGMVVESVPGRDEWNAIDPNLIIDEEGTGWLSFGSFWRGIKMFKLDETLTRPAVPQVWFPLCRRPDGTVKETVSTDTAVHPDPRGTDFDAGNGAVEAPFIIRRGGFYYLFVSFDLCCRGEKSTYNVVVGRSEKVTGPYLAKDGAPLMYGAATQVVKGNERYPGVGHCAVENFGGKDYMFFHAYDKDNQYSSKLLVREVHWSEDGWPSVDL